MAMVIGIGAVTPRKNNLYIEYAYVVAPHGDLKEPSDWRRNRSSVTLHSPVRRAAIEKE